MVWVLGGRPVLRDRRFPVARGSKSARGHPANPLKPTEGAETGAAVRAISVRCAPANPHQAFKTPRYQAKSP